MPDTRTIEQSPARTPDAAEVALIRRCQEGREDAFRELMEKYERRVYWIAYSMLSNYDNARDIAQEAFIRVFRNIGRFDVTKKFYTWLYQITINLCIDRRRKLSNGRTIDIDGIGGLADPSLRHPALGIERAELRVRVQRTLDRLTPPYKAVLSLRDIQGFSCGEIAEIVGCTNATVRWRLYRARQLFRAIWEDKDVETGIDSEAGP